MPGSAGGYAAFLRGALPGHLLLLITKIIIRFTPSQRMTAEPGFVCPVVERYPDFFPDKK